jgi:hypothetical protein
MALASSNRAQVRFIPEATFGVTPNTGNCTNLRATGETLAFEIQTTTSQEIRADRQITDVVQTGASTSGGVNFELSYKEYDPFIEAVLQGTWAHFGTAGLGTAAAVGINSTAGTLTWGVAPTGSDALTNLEVGQWFKLIAPSDAANGAYLKVASRTSTTITVDASTPIPGTGTRAAVAGTQVKSSRVKNGTTQRSFSIEKEFADVAQFFLYKGMTASKMSLQFQTGAILTGNFDFMGTVSARSGTTQLPGTPVTSQAFDVMNAVSGVGNIYEAGVPLTGTFIKSINLDVDNALRGQDAIGTMGFVGIASGTISVGGAVEMYLADGTMYDKLINNTSSSLSWFVRDGLGNGYVITAEKVKFSGGGVTAGGLNQDVMLSMNWQGLMDATGKTLAIDRL